MTTHYPTRWLCALFISIVALLFATHVDSATQYQVQLKRVQEKIAAIQKSIATKQSQRGKLANELKQSELEIASIAGRMLDLSTQSQHSQRELHKLDKRLAELLPALRRHRQSLKKLVQVAYQTGRTPRIQLFLNQQDPALISRMLNYYDYFNRARQNKIEQTLALLDELQQVRDERVRINQKLEDTYEILHKQQASMQQARAKRRASIAKLGQSLHRDNNLLSKLRQDQQDLEQLIGQLNQVLADTPSLPLERKPFKSMRGKLPWPVTGPLRAHYNNAKGTTGLRWKGMLIGAKTGSEVRAIYHGRVAFADWMNGFGLIAIIDHSDGYMTIYANNRTLRKTQGEWVKPGEVIATTGDSGGQSSAGTYFEIRRNGRTVNPHSWVKKSIKPASIQ